MNLQELEILEKISKNSKYAVGANMGMINYSYELLLRNIRGNRLLEMGPAEGVMTERLISLDKALTVVEGSSSFCESLRLRFPDINVVHSLFEDYQPDTQFDTIVLGHVLEHVEDPVDILRRAKNWLAPKGCIFAAVPNARSIHRQAAVLMGLLPQEDALNDADLHHGHRRVFNPESFRSAFSRAGLHIDVFGGYWLKPVSNAQIESDWTAEMVDAFMRLGERYPDIAGEIYVVASS